MVRKRALLQRGDTLVEVLMAIVIMSVIIVGTLTIMSRGLASGQLSVEHSQVRLHVNGQLDLLTYLRDQYLIDPNSAAAATWKQILDNTNTQPFEYDGTCAPTPAKLGPTNTTFYLTKAAGVVTRQPFNPALTPATIAIPGRGLWVEARNALQATNPPYVDLVIRACWAASGGLGEQLTVTAIRLYTPYDPLP